MTCILCGNPFGNAKFVTQSGTGFVHVVCEQDLLNEPYVELKPFIWYEFGIRSGGAAQ